MAHPHSRNLLHSSDSVTDSASTTLRISVSSSGLTQSSGGEDFNSHVKRLVRAFQVLTEEVEALRKQYPSASYIESDCLRKGKTSVDHICRCMRWDVGTREDIHSPSPAQAEQLEMDFTTKGKESGLACPFASMSGSKPRDLQKTPATPQQSQNRPRPISETKTRHSRSTSDPITAELHGVSLASPPPSTSAPTPKCPIRYLDQHSPEEVAQYFESHKHELPRSHEICVKRYQSNKESIRQLDAKYGDLVSMIQGLGITHKPLLPAEDDDEDDGVQVDRGEGNGRLVKWAERVDGAYGEADDEFAVEEEEEEEEEEGKESNRGRYRERDVNSDRILKEVRVGESPSRPWGIPIPPLEEPKLANDLSEHARDTVVGATTTMSSTTNVPGREANTKRKACQFRSQQQQQQPQDDQQPQHQSPTNIQDPRAPSSTGQFIFNAAFIPHQPPSPTTGTATASGGNAMAQQQTQMVFTGPVFIGYPIEQAMALLRQWNGGGGGMQG